MRTDCSLWSTTNSCKGTHLLHSHTDGVTPRIVDMSDLFQENTEGDIGKSTPVSDIPVESVDSNKQQIEVQSRSKPTDKHVKVSNRLSRG